MTMSGFINGVAHGPIALKLLANGMKTNALRTNATLLKDEWKQIDTEVLKAWQSRLRGVAALKRRGLVYSFANGLARTVLEGQTAGDVNDAEMSMDGLTKGKNDRIESAMTYFPLPLIHADFNFSVRQLSSSRTGQMPLDTTMSGLKAVKIAEKQEKILFQGGSSFSFGGGTLYGYVDHPSRETGTLLAAWDDSDVTGEDIVRDVLAMKQILMDNLQYGPYELYIPAVYETKMDEDYNPNSANPQTIRARLLAIEGIQAVTVIDQLTAVAGKEQVVLVQMRTETVRMVTGLPIQTVEWNEMGGMVFNFKIMTIDVPQIRADQNGRCGVAHFSEP